MFEGWSWIPRWSQQDVEQAAAGELNYHHVRHPMTSWIREAHAAPWKGICFGMMNDIEWYFHDIEWFNLFQRCCMMLLHDVAWCVAILDILGLQKNVEYFSGDLRSGLVLTIKAEHCSRQVPREAGRPGHCRWKRKMLEKKWEKHQKFWKNIIKHPELSDLWIATGIIWHWHRFNVFQLSLFSNFSIASDRRGLNMDRPRAKGREPFSVLSSATAELGCSRPIWNSPSPCVIWNDFWKMFKHVQTTETVFIKFQWVSKDDKTDRWGFAALPSTNGNGGSYQRREVVLFLKI